MQNLSLLGSTARVVTPFIKVQIGDYTFGVYEKVTSTGYDEFGTYKLNKIRYPNYIQKLDIQKVNGTVNKYTLQLDYPITEKDDPNFFEKVFSSVSKVRKIIFSYGDMSQPTFIYKDEEGIILDIRKKLNLSSSIISYTIKAVSIGTLSTVSSSQKFPATHDKPSKIIREILYDEKYGLLEVFPGMKDRALVEQENLILSDDVAVDIEAKSNISTLDYLCYLVDIMRSSADTTQVLKKNFYVLNVVDDTSGKFDGVYFKLSKVDSKLNVTTAYELDVGYHTKDVILNFDIDNDETYSIYYDFASKVNDAIYVQRVNDRGEIEEVLAPIMSSGTASSLTTEAEKSWWSKVTEFPIKAKVTFKGLLRPAMLMSYVKVNILFYGRKFIDSGLYIVTKEVDSVDASGFKTTLSLLRVDKAEPLE